MRAISQLVAASALALALGCGPDAPTTPPPPPLEAPPAGPTDADRARLTSLAARFADTRCDQFALAELRDLRTRFGSAFARDALLPAFEACAADSAKADLLAETLPASPTAAQRAEVGQALFEAARYDEAAAVFVPLADAAGPGDRLQWLAGMALLHTGRPEDALPRLLDGADTATPGDRAMILGLAYLANGATSDAVSYLEAARAEGANPHSVLPALARGYAELGRLDEAKAAEQAALAANAAQEQRERTTVALSATLTRLKAAWAEERYSEVEDAIADAWPLAPPRLRVTLQEYRVEVLAKTDRLPAARAAKDELDAMKAALTGDR